MNELLKLLVLESEEIYGHIYEMLSQKNVVKLLCVINDFAKAESIRDNHPDVVLVGTRKLDIDIISKLAKLFADNGNTGLISLFSSYNQADIQRLREIAPDWMGGIAVFLRQSLGHTDQLINIIKAVSQGQVILDPSLAYLMIGGKSTNSFLPKLTKRELEILDLLADGQTNLSIAESLFIDVKTVEHHLNSMYGKLKADDKVNDKHPRVAAARLYLEEVGKLVVVR